MRQHVAVSALPKIKQSSANKSPGIRSAFGYSLTPIPELFFNDSVIKLLAKSSIHIIKMYGESGSPCLIHLEGLIKPIGSLLSAENMKLRLCIP